MFSTDPRCLGTVQVLLTGVAGFEPAHAGIKTRCLTAWLYPIKTLSV